MPFKSEKQRKWMWANDPEMAEKWANEEDPKELAESQLREIIRCLLLEKEEGLLSKVGKYIDTGEWGDEEFDKRKHRHPKLNAIVDAVNDAIGDVEYSELKHFLWGLNHDFANKIKIERIQKRVIEDMLYKLGKV